MSAFGEGPDEDRMFCLDSWTVSDSDSGMRDSLCSLSLSNLRTTTIDNAAER